MHTLQIQNEQLLSHIRTDYSSHDIDSLRSFLIQRGTFEFPMLATGLFPAARLAGENHYTGYDNVWVRDNIHIAHAYYVKGRVDIAVRTVEALRRYFQVHAHRFTAIIQGEADSHDPMQRPHIRFNGCTLQENSEVWSHAQNDALGYFCWLFCRLARDGRIVLRREHWELLGLFPLYFNAVQYWQDEDSGHWEEARKIEASSIGAVVAAMQELRSLMRERSFAAIPCLNGPVEARGLDELITHGTEALSQILPSECIQSDPAKQRRYDAALLFLIYPLQVVTDQQADQILHDVETHLQGDYGVRRYLGDSFWCADYKSLRKPEERTSNVSESMEERNALLQPGQEAQWCIFDPILSTIYGRRFAATGSAAFRQKQVEYLNRSLGHLTQQDRKLDELLCPELYYLEAGRRVPNDVTPLLWTQANLSIALDQMQKTASLSRSIL